MSENVFSLTYRMFEIRHAFWFIGNFGCSQEILSIAAMMQIQNVFVVPSNQKSQAVSPTVHSSLAHFGLSFVKTAQELLVTEQLMF